MLYVCQNNVIPRGRLQVAVEARTITFASQILVQLATNKLVYTSWVFLPEIKLML